VAAHAHPGLRDHNLLQAIARVNRPYNDLKAVGVIIDYFGVFEKLQDALNFDKDELGEVAFPLTRLWKHLPRWAN
jgi:type I restriction enzyme R subunit